jgi:hypothetical protein
MSTTDNTAGVSIRIAPDPIFSGPAEFWHCVQLYDNDEFLSEVMGRFMRESLGIQGGRRRPDGDLRRLPERSPPGRRLPPSGALPGYPQGLP